MKKKRKPVRRNNPVLPDYRHGQRPRKRLMAESVPLNEWLYRISMMPIKVNLAQTGKVD